MFFNMSFVESDEATPYRIKWGYTEIAKVRDAYTLKVVTASCSFAGATNLAEAIAQVEKWTAPERKFDPAAVVLLNPEAEETPASAATDDEGKSLASNSTHRAYLNLSCERVLSLEEEIADAERLLEELDVDALKAL